MGLPASAALVGASLALAAGLGYVASTEHAKRVSAEHAQQAWKDSVAVAVRHADSAVADFRTLDSLYHHRAPTPPPRFVERIDSVLVPAAGDTSIGLARIAEVRRLVDSLQTRCKQDSLAQDSINLAARRSVDKLQTALHLALHPPPAPKEPRVAFSADGAWDFAAHAPYVGAGVVLRTGALSPYAQVGATLGPETRGEARVGVLYTFR